MLPRVGLLKGKVVSVSYQSGQEVISSQIGLGEIQGVEKIGGSQEFYIIQAKSTQIKTFVPVEDTKGFRTISSAEKLLNAMKSLGEQVVTPEFERRQLRVTYYKRQSQKNDIETCILTIKELHSLSDRGKVEDRILSHLIETLALELSVVFNMNKELSIDVINNALEGEKYEL